MTYFSNPSILFLKQHPSVYRSKHVPEAPHVNNGNALDDGKVGHINPSKQMKRKQKNN